VGGGARQKRGGGAREVWRDCARDRGGWGIKNMCGPGSWDEEAIYSRMIDAGEVDIKKEISLTRQIYSVLEKMKYDECE
jgi:hypothetical protein